MGQSQRFNSQLSSPANCYGINHPLLGGLGGIYRDHFVSQITVDSLFRSLIFGRQMLNARQYSIELRLTKSEGEGEAGERKGGNGAKRRRRMGSAASPGRQTSAQFASPTIPLLRSSLTQNSDARVGRRQVPRTTACSRARRRLGPSAKLLGKRLRFFAPATLRQV